MDSLHLKATAHVTITKLDEQGNVVGTEVHDVELTKEEAEALWHLRQQE